MIYILNMIPVASDFNFVEILKGKEDWFFVLEIGIRTIIMYLAVLFALTILGKRGVKQLSIFELVIIISFGSAAGDPMFYKDVGLISAFTVFIVVILCYKLTTYLIFKSERIEKLIEGVPIQLIHEGRFSIGNFKKEPLGYDEFFAEMRQQGVSHLGQISLALIEVSGEISLYYYSEEDVKFGLPILPHLYDVKHVKIKIKGIYSCNFCGFTEAIPECEEHICKICNKNEWIKSVTNVRIT
ncbi:DUF421 domain-containing protein [Flavobacterium sp.]